MKSLIRTKVIFQFVVCVEWDKNNIINVLGIAKALGWKFEIVK